MMGSPASIDVDNVIMTVDESDDHEEKKPPRMSSVNMHDDPACESAHAYNVLKCGADEGNVYNVMQSVYV